MFVYVFLTVLPCVVLQFLLLFYFPHLSSGHDIPELHSAVQATSQGLSQQYLSSASNIPGLAPAVSVTPLSFTQQCQEHPWTCVSSISYAPELHSAVPVTSQDLSQQCQ